MTILTIKTDQPDAEVGLYIEGAKAVYMKWGAHTELTKTINKKIKEVFKKSKISQSQLDGLIVFEGPGSFTGLRIGTATANALAYSLGIPIVGSAGKDWIANGVQDLKNGKNQRLALPKYGASVKTTIPRK